jgi:hypothetical protein
MVTWGAMGRWHATCDTPGRLCVRTCRLFCITENMVTNHSPGSSSCVYLHTHTIERYDN